MPVLMKGGFHWRCTIQCDPRANHVKETLWKLQHRCGIGHVSNWPLEPLFGVPIQNRFEPCQLRHGKMIIFMISSRKV